MSLDTYAGLKQAIADTLDRDDLDSHIDDFIDIAEARHKREIKFRSMLSRQELFVFGRYVDLPDGFLEAEIFRLLTTPVTDLKGVNLHEMNRRRREESGKPQYFTVHAQIELDVVPLEVYTGEMVFYKELTALSDSKTSNALLTRAPDAYLYASLSASAPFLMNDERLQLWEALYAQARDGLNAQDRRSKHIGPVVSRPAGATP